MIHATVDSEEVVLAFPVHVPPMAWAAGVLDAVGQMWVPAIGDRHGPVVRTSHVRLELAQKLQAVLGGRVRRTGQTVLGYWEAPPGRQEAIVGRILPYLRVQAVADAASRVLQWRLTAPKRRPRWRVSPAVRKHREGLGSE